MTQAAGSGAALVEFLRSHERQGWQRARGASDDEIAKIEKHLGIAFGTEYRGLLGYSNGGELEGARAFIQFHDTHYLKELNPHPVWSKSLPGMVFIGTDGGEYIYYLDPLGRLGKGGWAVFGVAMGSSNAARSMFLGADLLALCKRVVSGEAVLESPYLKDLGVVPTL